MEEILIKLDAIIHLLQGQKQILTLDEFCSYAGISKAHAYHLTSNGKIKFYRPTGKIIMIAMEDAIEFLKQNPVDSTVNQKIQINNLLLKKK